MVTSREYIWRVVDSPTDAKTLENRLNELSQGDELEIKQTIQYDKHGHGPHALIILGGWETVTELEPVTEPETEDESETDDGTSE